MITAVENDPLLPAGLFFVTMSLPKLYMPFEVCVNPESRAAAPLLCCLIKCTSFC